MALPHTPPVGSSLPKQTTCLDAVLQSSFWETPNSAITLPISVLISSSLQSEPRYLCGKLLQELKKTYMKHLLSTPQVGSHSGLVRSSSQLTDPQLSRTSRRQVWPWQSVQSLLDSWFPVLACAPDRSLPSSSEVPPLLPGGDLGPKSNLPLRA